MGCWKHTLVIHREQIEYIHSLLQHGDKRALAAHVGISYKLLSRYINYKHTKCFSGFKMPSHIYDRVMHFVHLKTSADQY